VATPQYGAPPPPPPPEATGTDRTTLFGILGIVLDFCCWPAGVVFAILSVVQARKHGSSPVLGYIGIGLVVVGIIIDIIYFSRR
jgi:hypothetical protein